MDIITDITELPQALQDALEYYNLTSIQAVYDPDPGFPDTIAIRVYLEDMDGYDYYHLLWDGQHLGEIEFSQWPPFSNPNQLKIDL